MEDIWGFICRDLEKSVTESSVVTPVWWRFHLCCSKSEKKTVTYLSDTLLNVVSLDKSTEGSFHLENNEMTIPIHLKFLSKSNYSEQPAHYFVENMFQEFLPGFECCVTF